MNTFLTIYQKDYIPKKVKDPINKKEFFIESEYKNPINESFKTHLHIDDSKPDECLEEVNSYYDKAKGIYPAAEKYITKDITDGNVVCGEIKIGRKYVPVNKNVIKKEQMYDGRSMYQVDYCDIEKELEYKEFQRKNAVILPLDIYIPLTTQKSGYREPRLLNSRCYESVPRPKAQNNLTPNYKVREILKVTTGWSEYTNKIGNLGKEIIETELHGPVRHDFRNNLKID